MSELKSEKIYRQNMFGKIFTREVYEKSEADKVLAEKDKELRHNKYKRCLAMAKWCEERSSRYDVLQEKHDLDWSKEIEFYYRWYMRWLELAEEYK